MTNPDDPIGIGEFQQLVIQKGESYLDKAVEISTHSKGLTKREWFAGLAMQALITAVEVNPSQIKYWTSEGLSIFALKQADALIAELNK